MPLLQIASAAPPAHVPAVMIENISVVTCQFLDGLSDKRADDDHRRPGNRNYHFFSSLLGQDFPKCFEEINIILRVGTEVLHFIFFHF